MCFEFSAIFEHVFRVYSIEGTSVQFLALESIVVMETVMKHCWASFGHAIDHCT